MPTPWRKNKPCSTPDCGKPARPGNRYCMTCESKIKEGMKASGYLTEVPSEGEGRVTERQEWINGFTIYTREE